MLLFQISVKYRDHSGWPVTIGPSSADRAKIAEVDPLFATILEEACESARQEEGAKCSRAKATIAVGDYELVRYFCLIEQIVSWSRSRLCLV